VLSLALRETDCGWLACTTRLGSHFPSNAVSRLIVLQLLSAPLVDGVRTCDDLTVASGSLGVPEGI
jgi:hypothetical protein